jgi:hypothetical protein
VIRRLAAAVLALALYGPALAAPAPPPPLPAAPTPPPLAGWDRIHFGMTSKALLAAYPDARWTEEAGIDAGSQKRTFRTQIDGVDFDITVILTADRVSRVTVAKLSKPGLDEAACKAAFAPEEAKLRKLYGPPSETTVRGARWQMGAGSRVVIVNVLLQPDDGTPTQCLVTTGYYGPGSPPPAPAG